MYCCTKGLGKSIYELRESQKEALQRLLLCNNEKEKPFIELGIEDLLLEEIIITYGRNSIFK